MTLPFGGPSYLVQVSQERSDNPVVAIKSKWLLMLNIVHCSPGVVSCISTAELREWPLLVEYQISVNVWGEWYPEVACCCYWCPHNFFYYIFYFLAFKLNLQMSIFRPTLSGFLLDSLTIFLIPVLWDPCTLETLPWLF